MDFDAFERDVTVALSKLPLPMLKTVAGAVLAHKEALIRDVPQLFEQLKPHVMAAVMEGGMGTLETGELETRLIRALATFGVEVPSDGKV